MINLPRAAALACAAGLCALLPPGPAPAQGVPGPSAAKRPTTEGYSLAFVDADVRRVVDAVLGSMLEADYSVDPAVQGNITLRTRQPVPRTSLLPLLEQALGSVNAVILVQGGAYRVVPRKSARTAAPLAETGSGAEQPVGGYAAEVFTLRNGSAAQVAKILEQFLGKDVIAGTDPARNQIIVTGSAEERQAARTLVARFDIDNLAGMNFELYRLENVDAETLLAEMERIFQPPFDIIGSRIRLVPLPRLRSILAVAAERADIDRVEPWIRRLDAGTSGKRRLYSYIVQNGRARDLATSLQLVLGTNEQAGRRNRSGAPRRGPPLLRSSLAVPSPTKRSLRKRRSPAPELRSSAASALRGRGSSPTKRTTRSSSTRPARNMSSSAKRSASSTSRSRKC